MRITTIRQQLEVMLIVSLVMVAGAMFKYEQLGENWIYTILWVYGILFNALLLARIYEVAQKKKQRR